MNITHLKQSCELVGSAGGDIILKPDEVLALLQGRDKAMELLKDLVRASDPETVFCISQQAMKLLDQEGESYR